MSDNPFEAPSVPTSPPSATAEIDAEEGPWRHPSNQLVSATARQPWPRRCARCNSTDVPETPNVVRVSQTPAILYLAFFFGIIWFFIGSYFMRQHARLPVFLCDVHARERVLWRFGKPLGLLAGLFACIMAFGATSSELALVGMLVVLFVWIVAPPEPLRAKRIVGTRVDVLGVDEDFAAGLPLWKASQFEAVHSDIPDLD